MVDKFPKILVIVGPTAVGKTKLSIELASRFNGEIVSADSMQIYRGFDIGSAKASISEQNLVPHHLLSIIDPTDISFHVGKWVSLARCAITDILARSKLPIIVGGSHYYIDNLLFPKYSFDPATPSSSTPPTPHPDSSSPAIPDALPSDLAAAEAYALLSRIDPLRAQDLHPRDLRKVRRALEIYYSTGKLSSAQRLETAQCPYDAFFIQLQAEAELLNQRVDARVASMKASGIISEIDALADIVLKDDCAFHSPLSAENPVGIWQAIGFKEFIPYLSFSHPSLDLIPEIYDSTTSSSSSSSSSSSDLTLVMSSIDSQSNDPASLAIVREKLIDACLTNLAQNTRRYVKYQTQYLTNTFVPQIPSEKLLVLDTSDPSRWDEFVSQPSLHHVRQFLASPAPDLPSLPQPRPKQARSFCSDCDLVLIGDSSITQHFTSNRHRKRVRNLKRRQK